MAAKKVNHTNQRYHHLTMMYPTRNGGAGVGMFWMARCDCGELKEVRGSEAKKGYVKTCGKCEYHSQLLKNAASKSAQTKDPQQPEKELYKRYVYGALKRNLEWKLTVEEFVNIIKQNCSYCGNSPRDYSRALRKGKGKTYKLVANGIDRINNKIGYTLNNSTACCSTCNRMKGTMDLLEFAKHIIKTADILKVIL